jgi:hypothetical protein
MRPQLVVRAAQRLGAALNAQAGCAALAEPSCTLSLTSVGMLAVLLAKLEATGVMVLFAAEGPCQSSKYQGA